MIRLKNAQINKDLAEIENIDFDLVRIDTDSYFEAVLLKNKLPQLVENLEKIFKAGKWPSEKEPPPEIEKIISGFGGVRGNQSLYFLREGQDYVCALLWPWQDQEHITLKILHG